MKLSKVWRKILAVSLVSAILAGTGLTTTGSFDTGVSVNAADVNVSNDNPSRFSWDNATVYFLLTDRFNNGDSSNDNAYGRQDVALSDQRATFHGGDFAGITDKINEGYFDNLGVNAIWLTAPYEQIHGYVLGDNFAHYSYHGYYVLDYTEPDAAFGTKQEFQTLVDTAHEHGIRIVMDVVMNHAGYNNMTDMNEYNYGTLLDGWKSVYDSGQLSQYHSMIDYTSDAAAWGRWWGSDWVRSGLPGYTEGSGNELTQCLTGLPDFKTEQTTKVGIPQFLQTKWTNEGTLEEKIEKYGSSNTVTGYLSDWLADWVRTYGVDGFRCDTAKHVDKASWKQLKDKCVEALKEWKQANPTKKLDDLDFWMTGEHWDHGVYKDSYYTEGGFDSMINFETTGGSLLLPSKVAQTYQSYADKINSDPSFNVLSYISSHDTVLTRSDDMYYMGSAFLLMPGAVQIYYGDETNRQTAEGVQNDGNGGAGHSLRSDMNFGENADLTAHWGIVGRFRNNHLAVGAGANTALDSSNGIAFARIYDDDKIAAVINANGSVSVNVSSLWNDGTELENFYDSSKAVVADGTVTFNAGEHGTILIQEPTAEAEESGTVTVQHIDSESGSVLKTQTLSGVVGNSYSVSADTQLLENYELVKTEGSTTGTYSSDNEIVKFYYRAVPITALTVHYYNTSWSKVNIYAYDKSETKQYAGAWPGAAMTNDGNGWWSYNFSDIEDALIIFNDTGTSQDPGHMQPGYHISDESWIKDGQILTENPEEPIISSISLDKETAEVEINKTVSLTAAVTPDGSAIVWSSSDDSIATVSDTGVVTGIKAGKATITAALSGSPDVSASAEITVTDCKYGENVYYNLDSNGTLNIYGTGAMYDYQFDGDYCDAPFYESENVKEVIIHDGVTSIGKLAFCQYWGLVDVSIPDSVTFIDEEAFSNCTELTSVVIPNGVTSIGKDAFRYCYNLKNIYISDSVTNIGDCAFGYSYPGKIEDVTITGYRGTAAETYANENGFTFIALDEPIITKDVRIYFDNSSYNWSNVYAYVYTGDGASAKSMAAWPGVKMTEKNSQGYFMLNVAEGFENGKVLFNDGTGFASNRYPGDQEPGLPIGGSSKVLRQNHYWDTYTEEEPFTVTLNETEASVKEGQTVSLTATVSPEGQAVVWLSSDDSIATVSDTGVVTGIKAGTATITAALADNQNIKASAEITVKAVPAELVNVSSISASTVQFGTSVIIKGKAQGGTPPYSYEILYKLSSESNWKTLQDYSTNASVSFKPEKTGTYNIRVTAKDADGTRAEKNLSVKVKALPLENTSVLAATEIYLGETIDIMASAAGGTGDYKYQVLYKQKTVDKWSSAQSYNTNDRVSIKPSQPVVYDVCVKVKDSNNTEVKKYFEVNVIDNRIKNISTLSASSIVFGDTVTVNAAASGSTGFYQYAVYTKKTYEKTWSCKQTFKANPIISVKPNQATAYDICVKVRDNKGTVAKKYFVLEVTEKAEELANHSTISDTEIALGEEVTVLASANGSTGFYQYAVFYKSASDTDWTTVQDYSAKSVVSIKPDLAENYSICVSIRDDLNNEVNKYFTLTVGS